MGSSLLSWAERIHHVPRVSKWKRIFPSAMELSDGPRVRSKQNLILLVLEVSHLASLV